MSRQWQSSLVRFICGLTLITALAGCAHEISGTYVGLIDIGHGPAGLVQIELEFASNNTVVVHGGIPDRVVAGYRIEDDRVILAMPNETNVLRMVDHDTLTMGSNGEIRVVFHRSAEAKGR